MNIQRTPRKLFLFQPHRPEVSAQAVNEKELIEVCPTGAIATTPCRIDLGKCNFCERCSDAFPLKIKFTKDVSLATNVRENLFVIEGQTRSVGFDFSKTRIKNFQAPLTLLPLYSNEAMEISNSSVLLNADFNHVGISFINVAEEANGIVILGEMTSEMMRRFEQHYKTLRDPKILILAGSQAISGGILGADEQQKRFLQQYAVDLYVPGAPVHPLTFTEGINRLRGTSVN
jgi:Ni,Fe-hydrogenase III small subunit